MTCDVVWQPLQCTQVLLERLPRHFYELAAG